MLCEGPRHVLEQPRPVPRVDCDLDEEAPRGAAVPVDRREPLRVPPQRLDVRAVGAVDRDALPHRDVADDLVSGNRRAALGETDEDVVDALDADPEIVPGDRAAALRRLERNRLFLRHFLSLEAVQDLVDDLADGHLARTERNVEVLRLLEARLADHLRQHGRADELLVGQALLLQRLLERLAALSFGLVARLAGEPLPDLVARA